MDKKVERLRAVETTAKQVQSLIINLSAIGDFKEVDFELMESFKSIMHLGTEQLKKFIDLLESKGKDLDVYSIYYYTKQLRIGPLQAEVNKLVALTDESVKTYWKLSPDTLGLLGNINRSQVNVSIPDFSEALTNIDSLTVAKMPVFIVQNIQEANLVANSMFDLACTKTLDFDNNQRPLFDFKEKLYNLFFSNDTNKSPHGLRMVSDTETLKEFQGISSRIQPIVKEFLGEEDYRVYLGKRLYNLFTSANKTSNIQVKRKLEYTEVNLDSGERELKSVEVKTNLIGSVFDGDEYRKKDISIDTPGKNKKLKLHTVEGQLGGLNEIKPDPLVKDTDASLGTPSGSVLA